MLRKRKGGISLSLGERIYRFRTQRNLSQEALAEVLNVSRQSVSKWENNSAVPDLQKIVLLADIFEVSIDELVKGTEEQHAGREEKTPAGGAGRLGAKVAGTILLCMAFLVVMLFLLMNAGFAGLLYALPFLACGVICFACKRNTGLWCAWVAVFLVDLYLRFAAGSSWSAIRYTLQWSAGGNYIRFFMAWVQFAALLILIAVTVLRFGKRPFAEGEHAKRKLVISWAVFAVLCLVILLLSYLRAAAVEKGLLGAANGYLWVYSHLDWGRTAALAAALTATLRCIKAHKQHQPEK